MLRSDRKAEEEMVLAMSQIICSDSDFVSGVGLAEHIYKDRQHFHPKATSAP